MSRDSTLMAGRRFMAESLTATGQFWRQDLVNTVRDPAALTETPGRTDLFSSPCKIQAGSLGSLIPSSREQFAAGREITTIREIVKLPTDAPDLRPDDLFDVVEVGDVDDPALLGQTFRIVAPIAQSYATTRRFAIERVLS